MVKHISLILLISISVGCGNVKETKYLSAQGKPEGGHLDVVAGGKEYVLTKGIELDYVYKSSKGINRSIPIHLVKTEIGPPQQEQVFVAILTNALEDKDFVICEKRCDGYHYSFYAVQTGMHHGSRAWNWIGIVMIAVPTSTTRIQLEGVLEDPDGNPIFIYADKRAAKAFATKGEDILRSEAVAMAEDIAFEIGTMKAGMDTVVRAPLHSDVSGKTKHTTPDNTNMGSTSVQPGISKGEGSAEIAGVDDIEYSHPVIKEKPIPKPPIQIIITPPPENAEACFLQGVEYSETKQYNKAIWAYKAAIRLNPVYAEAHYNLAVIYKKEGLNNLARAHAEKAAEYQPDMKKAYKLLDELQQLQR